MYQIPYKTTTYADGRFCVDIVEKEDTYEMWVYLKDYGVKEFCFGLMREDTTLDDFLDTVDANLSFEEAAYLNEYAEDEEHFYAVQPEYADELGLDPDTVMTFDEFCQYAISHGEATNHIFWMFEEVDEDE